MIDNVELIHQKLYKPLLNFTRGFCKDYDLAEHVVNDVFSKLLERTELPVDLRGWLFLCAKNQVIDYYYEVKRLDSIEYALTKPSSLDIRPVEEEVIERVAREERRKIELHVLSLVEQLSPRRRQALNLRLIEGQSQREAARIMGVAEKSVSGILYQAVSEMRNHLEVESAKKATCSYGACKKERIYGHPYCENHTRVENAARMRRLRQRR